MQVGICKQHRTEGQLTALVALDMRTLQQHVPPIDACVASTDATQLCKSTRVGFEWTTEKRKAVNALCMKMLTLHCNCIGGI